MKRTRQKGRFTAARRGKMPNFRLIRRRKAVGDVSILQVIGLLLALSVLVFIILPLGGRLLGLTGGKAEAASLVRGLDNLMLKVEQLKEGGGVPHSLTVDDGFFLVSFNQGENTNWKAKRSVECGTAACLCACIDDKCEKISESKKGRDCRPLFGYNAVIAQDGIKGNEGKPQKEENKYLGTSQGFYFYAEGEKTFSLMVTKKSNNLNLGKN